MHACSPRLLLLPLDPGVQASRCPAVCENQSYSSSTISTIYTDRSIFASRGLAVRCLSTSSRSALRLIKIKSRDSFQPFRSLSRCSHSIVQKPITLMLASGEHDNATTKGLRASRTRRLPGLPLFLRTTPHHTRVLRCNMTSTELKDWPRKPLYNSETTEGGSPNSSKPKTDQSLLPWLPEIGGLLGGFISVAIVIGLLAAYNGHQVPEWVSVG